MERQKRLMSQEKLKKTVLRGMGIIAIASILLVPTATIATSRPRQPNPQWSLDLISDASKEVPFNQEFRSSPTGRGVTIVVIDSGVNDHADFMDESGVSRLVEQQNFVEGQGPEDCNGHGTHIAGITAGTEWGVAKEAAIASAKVLDCDLTGGGGDIAEALQYVAEHYDPSHTVVNMSLGMKGRILHEAVSDLTEQGFVVVAAANNDGVDACETTPAGEESAITVGAVQWLYTQPDAVNFYPKSNSGPCVDVLAPGFPIESTSAEDPHGTMNTGGSSQAAAYVSGVVALYKQYHPDASPEQVEKYIKQSAVSLISDAPQNTTDKVLQVGPLRTGVERSPFDNGAYTLRYHTDITETAPLTLTTTFGEPVEIQGDVVITDAVPLTTTQGMFYCSNEKTTCIYKSEEGKAPENERMIQVSAPPGKQIHVETHWSGGGIEEQDDQILSYGHFSFLPVINR